MVHLGTLSEERLEFLCQILEALWQQQPDARALIIGARPDQVDAAARASADGRATVMGKIDYQQVAELLGNCRIGLDVIPPLSTPALRGAGKSF